jgi:hypothetical protein
LKSLAKRVLTLEAQNQPRWIYLTTPLTSTSWDGDLYPTTAKTSIDLSTVFGAPAGIKAVLIKFGCSDSGSLTNDAYFILAPNSTSGQGFSVRVRGLPNSVLYYQCAVMACDTNGNIYYQMLASSGSSMACYIEIWGYLI